MRFHKIIIDGVDAGVKDGRFITPYERQHELAMENPGKHVRVVEYVTRKERKRKYDYEDEDE
jgi:hypothetical protein